jgi:hypothetical protein
MMLMRASSQCHNNGMVGTLSGNGFGPDAIQSSISVCVFIARAVSKHHPVLRRSDSMRISIPVVLVAMAMILFQFPVPGYCQRFLFGAKVAGQLTNTFTYPVPADLHEDRVLAGPFGEVRLWHGLSLEMDALYKRKWIFDTIGCCVNPLDPFTQILATGEERFHSWELPLILKGRLPVPRAHLFGGVGFSARNVAGTTHLSGTSSILTPGGIQTLPFNQTTSPSDWTWGPVVSAGADLRAGIVHVQPELRYIHWNDSPLGYLTKQDQVQALIGIAVGMR